MVWLFAFKMNLNMIKELIAYSRNLIPLQTKVWWEKVVGWARVGAVDRLAEEERFRRRKEVVREEREGHRLSRGMDRVERERKGRGEDYWKGGRLLKGGSEQSEGLHFFYWLLHALNRILVLEWFSLIYNRLFNCYYQQTIPLVIGFFILPFNGRGILTISFMDKL